MAGFGWRVGGRDPLTLLDAVNRGQFQRGAGSAAARRTSVQGTDGPRRRGRREGEGRREAPTEAQRAQGREEKREGTRQAA